MSIRPEICGVDIKKFKEDTEKNGKYLTEWEDDEPEEVIEALISQEGSVGTDSNEWKYYHNEYFEDIADKADDSISQLFNYFLSGRRISDDWGTSTEFPYAYWTLDEVKIVLEDMSKDWWKYDDSEKFGEAFKGWLQKIADAGKDLFFCQG